MTTGNENLRMLEQADVRHHSRLKGLPPHLQKLHRKQEIATARQREAEQKDDGWTEAERIMLAEEEQRQENEQRDREVHT